MGFLRESEPLSWEDSLQHLRFVREHGIEQFLAVLRQCRHIAGDPFKWGDEVEHAIFRLVDGGTEEEQRTVRVALRSPQVLAELRQQEAELADAAPALETCTWMPEYGRWMLESTPGKPYEGLNGLGQLERQMALRRKRLNAALKPGEVAPTVTSMPLFGTPGFCEPPTQPGGPATQSLFVPDEAIFPHPRFPTLTKNIATRRESPVEIRRPRLGGPEVPANAPVPTSVEEADALDHVYADTMAFGMGNCCLQVTMQAADISESRHLYDQLAPLTPLFLALTAATPFLRGWVCDDDTRWSQVAQAVDDRTPAERGSAEGSSGDARLAGAGVRCMAKSRYDSIDCYIGEGPDVAQYNDMPLVTDEEYVQRLRAAGCDETLAKHVAHLFARDPLVIFNDRINLDDEHDVDHWENLQSTNWQTLRWKPPPPEKAAVPGDAEGHIGWRVEFRSMEVQVTDFENAAFASLILLLSRVILDTKLNLYIPMSKLEANMRAAQRREACTQEQFWFRTHILPEEQADAPAEPYRLMTIEEIMLGSPSFPGLLPLCCNYVNSSESVDLETRLILDRYCALVEKRATGELPTIATWMRRFVMQHPTYQHDGRVPPAAAHDLMALASEIGLGQPCQELLGDLYPAAPLQAAGLPMKLAAPVSATCADCMTDAIKAWEARGAPRGPVCASAA